MEACHLVQGSHVREPAVLDPYQIRVCNAALDPAQLRTISPEGTRWLGSFNATMLSKVGPMNPYYNTLRAAMAPYRLLRADGTPVVSSAWGDTYFDYRNLGGARAYGRWIAEHYELDLYLDDLTKELPPHKVRDFPEELAWVAGLWPEWRDAFLDELRIYAPDKVIVGNTAGWIDRRLNGICIESSHQARLGKLMTLARFALATLGEQPTVSIDWAGNWEFPVIGLAKGGFLPLGGVPEV